MFRPLAAVALALLLLALLAAHPPATVSPMPPILSDGLGVNIHFTRPKQGEVEMLAASGMRWIRMDLIWAATETGKGVYNFSDYDRLIAALEPYQIRTLFILDYRHPLYDNGLSPYTEAGRQAFAQWAVAAARHFQGRGILWEVYNEPNIGIFWRPAPNVDDYIKLAIAVGKAFREQVPGEVLIGPAVAGMEFSFLEPCFKAGLLEYWSAVSVHPYRQTGPETVMADYQRLRSLIAQYAPPDKQILVISGEWGYSTVWAGMSEELQGKMLARQWLINLASEVALSIWYDWQDDGPKPDDPEHHFGLVSYPYYAGRNPVYDPKPAYLAAKTLTGFLNGYHFNSRLAAGSADDYVLLFSNGAAMRLAAWTVSRTPHNVMIPVSPGFVRLTAHTGESLGARLADQQGISLLLTDAPQYLIPEQPAIGSVVSVSAASYRGAALASEAVVAAFGQNLATAAQAAASAPLPTSLAGTSVTIKDSAGRERLAPLFFISPLQVNYQVPPGTATGPATVIITGGDDSLSVGRAQISTVEPGLFTSESSGRGAAIGYALRYRDGAEQPVEPLAELNPQNQWVTRPIDLGPESDLVFVILYGTGIRNRSSLAGVSVELDGVKSSVSYAASATGFVGLDQINVLLPRSLIGRGEIDVALTVDGQTANPVKINIK